MYFICEESRDHELLGSRLQKGALHFAGRWEGWKKGVFLASCASADTTGILRARVAQQSCTQGALCTTDHNQPVLSADGRKEELPREHFLSCNSLQLVEIHDKLWRLRTFAAGEQRPQKVCSQRRLPFSLPTLQ